MGSSLSRRLQQGNYRESQDAEKADFPPADSQDLPCSNEGESEKISLEKPLREKPPHRKDPTKVRVAKTNFSQRVLRSQTRDYGSKTSRRIIRGRKAKAKAKAKENIMKDKKSTNTRKISSSSRLSRQVNKAQSTIIKDSLVSTDNSKKRSSSSKSKTDSDSDVILPSRSSRRIGRKSQNLIISVQALESNISNANEKNSNENIPSTDAVNNNLSNLANNVSTDNTSKKNKCKYSVNDAVDLVIHNQLSVSEALRVTFGVCSRQHLYMSVKKRKKEIMCGENAGKVIGTMETRASSVSSSLSPPDMKKSRNSVLKSNESLILQKKMNAEFFQRYNNALKEAISLWTSTKETRAEKIKNPKYFGVDKTISQILKEVNAKYLSEDNKKITKGTLLRYYDNQWEAKVQKGPAPLLPDAFMNMIRLHMKVMQLSKKSQPSGNLMKQLITSSVVGTQYENCSARAAWDRVKRIVERKKLGNALDAKKKQLKGEKLKIQEMKGALSYCLKANESEELISSFKTKQQVEERLSQFEEPWWSYIPDSVPKEQLNPGEDTSSSSSVQSGDRVVRNEVGKEVHSLEEVLCTETLDV